jgi:hypothetical protein
MRTRSDLPGGGGLCDRESGMPKSTDRQQLIIIKEMQAVAAIRQRNVRRETRRRERVGILRSFLRVTLETTAVRSARIIPADSAEARF